MFRKKKTCPLCLAIGISLLQRARLNGERTSMALHTIGNTSWYGNAFRIIVPLLREFMVTGGLFSHSDVSFVVSLEKIIAQMIELPVIWDATAPMWSHCNWMLKLGWCWYGVFNLVTLPLGARGESMSDLASRTHELGVGILVYTAGYNYGITRNADHFFQLKLLTHIDI